MQTRPAGFTLIELLVALLLMSIVLAGAVTVFSSQNRTYIQEDLASSLEENLRLGMGALSDNLRTAGYGVPTSSLATWIPWVTGFITNPTISATAPPTISIASCFQDVATLSGRAAAGATTLLLTSSVAGKQISDVFDADSKRLILVDGGQNAQITAISGNSVTIDTDPTTAGVQGLSRSYPAGATVCRVDVRTFAISTDPTTGLPGLGLDVHQGLGSQPVAEGISNVVVATITAKQYQITLTARSEEINPLTGAFLTRSLTSNVTLKN
jgi:prepilin-type N-terminal cleavage/methylation domain-containing protein